MTDTNRRVRQLPINHDDRRRHSFAYRQDDDSNSIVNTVLAAEVLSGAFDSSPTPSFSGFSGGESGGGGASGSWDSSSPSSDSSSSSYDSGSSSSDSGSSGGSDF